MTKKEYLALLEEVLEITPGSLNGNESLDSLENWDSLAVVSFIALIDENLDLTLSPERIAKAKSVADLLAMAQDKLND